MASRSPPRRLLQSVLTVIGPLPFMALAILTAGLAAAVGVGIFHMVAGADLDHTRAGGLVRTGIALVLGYYAYGLSLLVIAPTINALLGGRLKPYRGSAVSPAAMRWYVHCTMTLIVRYSFLEFVTPSPFASLYYRLMGMRIGRGVTLNTTAIADPSLIEIADDATVGGSASLLAHYAQGGYLVVAPVRIGAGATIGMRAIVMGGVQVGAKAKVLAGSFVLPNTVIPDGEMWAGIPAARIELDRGNATDTMAT